jgi:cytochrome b subunit of formate dehydrogenase
VPERIQRHTLAARLFHWTMAASMLTLLFSAFVPIMNIDFPGWLTFHWVAGLVLIATIVYHIIHAIGFQDFWSMINFGPSFFKEGFATLRHVISSKAPEPPRAGKYPFDHRLYHHAIVIASTAAVVTGSRHSACGSLESRVSCCLLRVRPV